MTERILGTGYVRRSFAEWREIVFRQDPGKVDPWWASLAGDQIDHPNHVVDYLLQLCGDPVGSLEGLNDTEIARGLEYLVNMQLGGCYRELYRWRVEVERAVACVQGIYTLFERIFAPRCAPVLCHLSEPGAGELNGICFMWWDVISLRSSRDDGRDGLISAAMLDVLQRILALPSIACQESALHGLGHHFRAKAIVDAYVAANPGLRPELRAYAENARIGRVQ